MKRGLKFIGIFILGILLGCLVCSLIKRPTKVTINFVNKSSQKILSAKIYQKKNILLAENIERGESANVIMYVPSETGYSCIVTFANGSTVNHTEYYIEPGYKITENIYDTKIEPVLDNF